MSMKASIGNTLSQIGVLSSVDLLDVTPLLTVQGRSRTINAQVQAVVVEIPHVLRARTTGT